MADTVIYIVDNTDGTLSFSIQPRTFDGYGGVQRTTDLTLQGNGTPNWGERQNENFMRLLETSACPDKGALGSPVTVTGVPQDEGDLGSGRGINFPVTGQLWYNKTDGQVYVYNGTVWTISSTLDHGTLVGLLDNDHPQYVHEDGDTMNGPLVITDTISGSTVDLLRIQSNHGPTLNLATQAAPDSVTTPPAIVLYNANNDAGAGGSSGTHGYFRLTKRDGSYFTLEADTDDQDALFDGSTKTLLTADQATDQLIYWAGGGSPTSGGVRVPNQPTWASLSADHLITKQDLIDNAAGATPQPLVGKTFIPAVGNETRFFSWSASGFGPSGPTNWERIETVDLTVAGIIPANATHVVLRTWTNSNERGNNGITTYFRKNSLASWGLKSHIDVQLAGYAPSGNNSYEGEEFVTFIQEFDTTTNTVDYRLFVNRVDATTWGNIPHLQLDMYLEGWFIDDEATVINYIPVHVTAQREILTNLTGNPTANLTSITYTPSFDTLQVYLNGQKAIEGIDYTELTSSSFNWIGVPLVLTDVLECFSSETIDTGSENGFKNLIINGEFGSWQRGFTGTSVPPPQYADGTNSFTADRFCVRTTAGDVELDWALSTDVPNISANRSLEVTPQAADSVATSAAAIQYTIQHEDVRRLQYGASNAKPSVLSFWVKSSVTGSYSVNIRSNFNGNPGSTYSFIEEYTINAPNTWEKKEISVPALNVGGATPWVTGVDDIAGSVSWWLKGGTANSGTTGLWLADTGGVTSKYSPSQVNWKASASNTFKLTLVQWELGQVATDFEVLPRSQVRELCQMFYAKTYAFTQAPGAITDAGSIQSHSDEPVGALHNVGWSFPVTMKRSPDIRCWSTTGVSTYNGTTSLGSYRSNRGVGLDYDRTVGTMARNDLRVSYIAGTSNDPNSGLMTVYNVHYTADAEDYFNDPE